MKRFKMLKLVKYGSKVMNGVKVQVKERFRKDLHLNNSTFFYLAI